MSVEIKSKHIFCDTCFCLFDSDPRTGHCLPWSKDEAVNGVNMLLPFISYAVNQDKPIPVFLSQVGGGDTEIVFRVLTRELRDKYGGDANIWQYLRIHRGGCHMSIYENRKNNIWPNIDDQYDRAYDSANDLDIAFSNFVTDVANPLLIEHDMDPLPKPEILRRLCENNLCAKFVQSPNDVVLRQMLAPIIASQCGMDGSTGRIWKNMSKNGVSLDEALKALTDSLRQVKLNV